jgi:anti-anti-sigma factor
MELGRIDVVDAAGTRVVALYGEHDLSTAPDLEREISSVLASGSPLVLDLSGAAFIDSSVLGVIMTGHKRSVETLERGIAVVVAADTPSDRLAKLISLDTIVPTFATREEAIEFATSGGDPSSAADGALPV